MDFYIVPEYASPVRSIVMLEEMLGFRLNYNYVDLRGGEQLKPEIRQFNPLQTESTLIDNDFGLWESHAILIYLAEKYLEQHKEFPYSIKGLYPECPQKRALVNQRLYFDVNLYATFEDYNRRKQPEMFKKFEEQMELFNTFLEGETYAAGDVLTLADLALLSTISTFKKLNIEVEKFANIKRWCAHCSKRVNMEKRRALMRAGIAL